MKSERKTKRAAILAVIMYIMINCLVWGFMKAYVNSYNAVNHEQLVMANISDKSDGKEIEILGNSFLISKIENDKNCKKDAFQSLIPFKFRAVAEIFMQSTQNIVQLLQK